MMPPFERRVVFFSYFSLFFFTIIEKWYINCSYIFIFDNQNNNSIFMKSIQHILILCLGLLATSCLDEDFKPKSISDTSMAITMSCDQENGSTLVQTSFFNSNNYTTKLVDGNKVKFDDEEMPFYSNGSVFQIFKDKVALTQGVFVVEGDNGITYTNTVQINNTEVDISSNFIKKGDPLEITWDNELKSDETMSVYIVKNASEDNVLTNDNVAIKKASDDDGATSISFTGEETKALDKSSYKVVVVRTCLKSKLEEQPPLGGQLLTKLFLPHMSLNIQSDELN